MTRDSARSSQRPDPIGLLRRVVAGDEQAWHRLVESHLGFIYSLAWRYARGDVDLASELALVALEGLRRPDAEGRRFYRLRRYLESRAQLGGRSRFITWLAIVVKNLFRDWFREREGRRYLPQEIEGLAELEQRLFRELFWEGCSESEAWGRLRSAKPDLSPARFEAALDSVYAALADRNLWVIFQDLLRRLPIASLDAPAGSSGGTSVQVADPDPRSRPDGRLAMADTCAGAARIRALLAEGLQALPGPTRQVVQLLVYRGLSGEDVRRVMGFRSRQKVYDEMARARRRLRSWLLRHGLDEDDLGACLADLAACEEQEPDPGSRSSVGLRPDGTANGSRDPGLGSVGSKGGLP